MSTLLLGIPRMNACSHHAPTIIVFEYGSLPRQVRQCCNHLWLIIQLRFRSLRRERGKHDNDWKAMVWTLSWGRTSLDYRPPTYIETTTTILSFTGSKLLDWPHCGLVHNCKFFFACLLIIYTHPHTPLS